MKTFYTVVALVTVNLFFLSSCKKESSSDPENTTPSNGWKLGANTYTAVIVSKVGSTALGAMDGIPSGTGGNVNTCTAWFNTLPLQAAPIR